MEHRFKVELAKKYGVDEAIFLTNLHFWLEINREKGKNFRDGRYWSFSSGGELAKIFPYWSSSKIDRLVKKLRLSGAILVGNYNRSKLDKTRWFALGGELEKAFPGNAQSIPRNRGMDSADLMNGVCGFDETIPDSKQDNKEDNRGETASAAEAPPSLEVLCEFCAQNKISLDCKAFIDYYESRDWLIKGLKIQNWRALAKSWGRVESSSTLQNDEILCENGAEGGKIPKCGDIASKTAHKYRNRLREIDEKGPEDDEVNLGHSYMTVEGEDGEIYDKRLDFLEALPL